MAKNTAHTSGINADPWRQILDICQRLGSERNLPRLVELIMEEGARLMGADRATVFLVDSSLGEFQSLVALGTDQTLRFDAKLGVAGAALREAGTINVPDVSADQRFYSGVDSQTGYQTRNLLATPLKTSDGRILGVIEVINKQTGPFDQHDQQLLEALGTQVAIAVENCQLVEQLERQRDRLQGQNARLLDEVKQKFCPSTLVGSSQQMQKVVELIQQVAPSQANVLITGESGTGKELAARAIHFGSPRCNEPFIAINCAAIPEHLLESELFGIEKGVATGVERRIGRMEQAEGGTLFLDEIGDMSFAGQSKLLRAIQERTIERVGGRQPIPVDVRIIAATNRNLQSRILEGAFREDLFYRLNVIQIGMPALRRIPEDIPALARHFIQVACGELRRAPLKISPGAERLLQTYSWPGNSRELQNEVLRAVLLARGPTLTESDFSDRLRATPASLPVEASDSPVLLKEAIAQAEKELIMEALETCGQNRQQAARRLGLTRQGLLKKMKRYGIGRQPDPLQPTSEN
jgi:Nif-specific regulatory protein